MTFSKLGENSIIIDHTGVLDTLRGKGVGQKLVLPRNFANIPNGVMF